MSCPSCLKAQQDHRQGDYKPGCLGCQIRGLVHMEEPAREAMLDRIQFAHGQGARVEAVRLIVLERARQRALRARAAA